MTPTDQLTGSIIAERSLTAHIGETEVQAITARMAAPERCDDGCYLCHWELIAPGYRVLALCGGR